MNRLKELRERENLSLEELSTKVNIPKTSLSNYERAQREPKIEIWEKIADFFNVPVPYLMGMTDSISEKIFFEVDTRALEKETNEALNAINALVEELIKSNDPEIAALVRDVLKSTNNIFWISKFFDTDYLGAETLKEFSHLVDELNNFDFLGSSEPGTQHVEKYLARKEAVNAALDKLFIKTLKENQK